MRLKRVALSFCAWAICAAVMSGRRESLISAVVRRQVCFPRICIKRNPPGAPASGKRAHPLRLLESHVCGVGHFALGKPLVPGVPRIKTGPHSAANRRRIP